MPDDDNPPGLSRVIRDWFRSAEMQPKQVAAWAGEAVDLAETLVRDREDPHAAVGSLFWIKVHGIFADIEEWAENVRECLAEGTYAEDPRHDLIDAVLKAIAELRSAFSTDELVFIEYTRHATAHPAPGAFDHITLPAKEGLPRKIRDSFTSRTVRAPVKLVVISEAVKRVVANEPRGHRFIAATLATKALPQVRAVHEALRAWLNRPLG